MTPSGRPVSELETLRELTARTGSDPLLTQASTGNTSAKLDGKLWIKASGAWMADALRDDIFVPLDLAQVKECLRCNADPAEVFPRASLETAMHAVLPHRFVLHVHSVDAIAWAVRQDGLTQLKSRLAGLRWEWIPYVASGMPLACEIESARMRRTDSPDELRSRADVYVLGNHGLVIAADDAGALEDLLRDVLRRVAIRPRILHPADYSVLAALCEDSCWEMPGDDDVHALATDAASREILRRGFLYPCQTMFPDATTALFQPIARLSANNAECAKRPFLLIEDAGVVVNRMARPAEIAILSGLAQVLRRLSAWAPIRYLTPEETAALCCPVAERYMNSANARREHNTNAFESTGVVRNTEPRPRQAAV